MVKIPNNDNRPPVNRVPHSYMETEQHDLVMEALAMSLPDEWQISGYYDHARCEMVYQVCRLCTQLDEPKIETKTEYRDVHFYHKTFKNPVIDGIKHFCRTYLNATAPIYDPQYRDVVLWKTIPITTQHITTYTKVVARPGTQRIKMPRQRTYE